MEESILDILKMECNMDKADTKTKMVMKLKAYGNEENWYRSNDIQELVIKNGK